MPNISLSTDILVGYPTETNDDYETTINAVKKIRFDTAFMFKYSVRSGTKSSLLVDAVSEEEKLKRLQHLIETQNNITKQKNMDNVGKIEEVLFDNVSKRNKKYMIGKTDSFKNLVAEGNQSLIGKIKKVKIVELNGNTFKGLICE